ncbi:hypothetical protein [Streptomyces sp. NPDC088766]|uniref:hypothetical protein n=1 Tax=Streptomyces sp. NPDC088766 TaxID=3365893 RepID=UPI0038147454
MSGRTDSDTRDGIRTDATEVHGTDDMLRPDPLAEGTGVDGPDPREHDDGHDEHDERDDEYDERDDEHDDEYDEHDDEYAGEDARRARWTAAGTGALLTLAGFAAALLRLTGSAPALVPAAYALGAAVCALAALLGSRGRTRRALWLLIVGVMVMAVGDRSD